MPVLVGDVHGAARLGKVDRRHVVVFPAVLLQRRLRPEVKEEDAAVLRAGGDRRPAREEGAAVALADDVELVRALP